MLYLTTALFVASVLLPASSFAVITKLVIEKREPFAGGHEFGITGAYEKLSGKAYGAVDPHSKQNTVLVNLSKAPKNSAGCGVPRKSPLPVQRN